MRIVLISLALAVLLAVGQRVSARTAERPVGFVCHYPFVDVGMDQLPQSGANALIVRAVAGMAPREGEFDPWPLAKQLDYAEKHNLKLVLLIEANPVYSPPWLTSKCKERGECTMTPWGVQTDTPSMSSPTFAAWRQSFVKRVTDWVKANDKNRRIVAYQPGAEWWYPSQARFSPLDLRGFRKWLRSKYGSVRYLNSVWGASFASFEQVGSVPLVGETGSKPDGLFTFTFPQPDMSWSTHQGNAVRAEEGKTYVFSSEVKTRGVTGMGAHLAVALLSADSDVPKTNIPSKGVTGTQGWRRVEVEVTVPKGITRAWLLLKQAGHGRSIFRNPDFRLKGSETNLAPNPEFAGQQEPDKWFFDKWTGGKDIRGQRGTGSLEIIADQPSGGAYPCKNLNAAAYDWFRWAAEYTAGYIDGFAAECKRLDPTRPTMGYLTYSFSNPVEWDYAQENAILLDALLPRCRNLDIIGMQICSADGDPIRVLATIDQVRKYGKPVYVIDLVDFTSGTHIGWKKMTEVTCQALRHGASGIFYYCWNGTPDYNYSEMGTENLRTMFKKAGETSSALNSALAKVALVQPVLPVYFGDPGGQKNSFRDYTGLYKALLDVGYTIDVWTLEELAARKPDLSSYKAVLLSDCRFAKRDAFKVLSGYVRSGGRLVHSGRLPEVDEYGRKIALSGMKASSLGAHFGEDYLGKIVRTTHAGNTPPLFIETEDAKKLCARRDRMQAALRKGVEGTGASRKP